MKPRKVDRFQQGSGCYTCGCCGKLTRDVGNEYAVAVALCVPCYDRVTMENAHSDGNHDEEPDPDCPECKGKP